jgi:hypothetical protein
VIHVAYQLDEIEVAHLARGGTLWLTTYGGLPIHLIEVQEPGCPARDVPPPSPPTSPDEETPTP